MKLKRNLGLGFFAVSLHSALFGQRRVIRPTGSRYMPHQGKRECERRMRQIEQGILKP